MLMLGIGRLDLALPREVRVGFAMYSLAGWCLAVDRADVFEGHMGGHCKVGIGVLQKGYA